MKLIKYYLEQGEEILTEKRLGYSESNLEIAKKEAYLGEITIEEVEDDAQSL